MHFSALQSNPSHVKNGDQCEALATVQEKEEMR
jgi:hypothetical protein